MSKQNLEEKKAQKCWPGYEKKGTKKMFGKTVNNCVKKEEVESDNEEIVDEAKGEKDACYHKVKSRYKVWPSAYASGALVKCRKVGAKNWGNSKKESLRIVIEDELSQIMLEGEQDIDDLKKAIMKALRDEGGAAGMDALEKHTDASEEEIRKVINKEDDIQVHDDGDIIDISGLEKTIEEELMAYLLEKKQASSEDSLRDWFGRKGEKGSTGGWVDCNAPDGDGGYKKCAQGDRKKKPYCRPTPSACKEEPQNEELDRIIDEEIDAVLDEKKKKKACKPSKGKRFAKRVNGKCRSYGQKGKAKDGGDRIRPGTKKGDAYCARSAKIKKCKNPPCANALSRKKWKCRGSKSMKSE